MKRTASGISSRPVEVVYGGKGLFNALNSKCLRAEFNEEGNLFDYCDVKVDKLEMFYETETQISSASG
jgi:hypothetical protein